MRAQATIQSIYRYPVKGFTPEPLSGTELAVGQTLPADRRYAVENGPTGFNPAAPAYFPKIRFLMLMKNERLAQLRTHYDDATHVLTVRSDGREVARGDLTTPAGRRAIEDFMAVFCAGAPEPSSPCCRSRALRGGISGCRRPARSCRRARAAQWPRP